MAPDGGGPLSGRACGRALWRGGGCREHPQGHDHVDRPNDGPAFRHIYGLAPMYGQTAKVVSVVLGYRVDEGYVRGVIRGPWKITPRIIL